jgi:hypothetical protein
LTLNIGTRYTLNFPSTEKNDQVCFQSEHSGSGFRAYGSGSALGRFRASFRARVPAGRQHGDSFRLRNGFFEQSGITTPFTIPQFPFVQTVGQQSQDNLNAAFNLSSGPTVQ